MLCTVLVLNWLTQLQLDVEELSSNQAKFQNQQPGTKVDIEPDASAWECFQLFVDEELLNQMVEQTNLYTAQYKAAQDITANVNDPDDTSASLHVLKYSNKKVVTLLSTCSKGRLVDSGKTSRTTNQPIMVPGVVHSYNNNMNGVDQFDQHIQYYSFNRKTWKWWKRACFHLLHLAKVQAYLIYGINNPGTKTTQLQFTTDLIEQMMADSQPPKAFKRRPSDPSSRLKEKHFLKNVSATANKQQC
ncbi:hypothetical protein ACOMHN_030221 [Nucella lapillus]